jgi:hypothetical protein
MSKLSVPQTLAAAAGLIRTEGLQISEILIYGRRACGRREETLFGSPLLTEISARGRLEPPCGTRKMPKCQSPQALCRSRWLLIGVVRRTSFCSRGWTLANRFQIPNIFGQWPGSFDLGHPLARKRHMEACGLVLDMMETGIPSLNFAPHLQPSSPLEPCVFHRLWAPC